MKDILPCPFCDNPMLIEHGMFGHVDTAEFERSTGICPIGYMAWDEKFLKNWNLRKGSPAGFVSAEDFMKNYEDNLKLLRKQ